MHTSSELCICLNTIFDRHIKIKYIYALVVAIIDASALLPIVAK